MPTVPNPTHTAAEKEAARSSIESDFNKQRTTIEKEYVEAKVAAENKYHQDLKDNADDKKAAYAAAGLNSDGSFPMGRPTG